MKVPTFVPQKYQLSYQESTDFHTMKVTYLPPSQAVLANYLCKYETYGDFMQIDGCLYHRYILLDQEQCYRCNINRVNDRKQSARGAGRPGAQVPSDADWEPVFKRHYLWMYLI